MSNILKPFNKMMGAIGLIDEDNDEREDDIEEDEDFEPEVINSRKNKVVSIKGGSQTKVLLRKPKEFIDIMEIVDSIKSRRIVVMNISEVDQKNAQRMIDYVVGACYALNGSFEEVARSIYVIAPESVEISNELKQELDRNTFFSFSER